MVGQRSYTTLTNAEDRIARLKAVDPTMDFGDGRNLEDFTAMAEELRTKLVQHNQTVREIEASSKAITALETKLKGLSSKMLKGVGFEYGEDSDQYELAGGVKISDRIRKGRQTRLKSASETQESSEN